MLWGSSTRLGVGPTALTSLLIGTSLSGLAAPGQSAQWVSLGRMDGLAVRRPARLVLGLVRFGWLLNLVTSPGAQRLHTGHRPADPGLAIARAGGTARIPGRTGQPAPGLQHFDLAGAAMGLGSVAALWLARKQWPRFPAVIVVMGVPQS